MPPEINPFTCTTLTAANVDAILTNYSAFQRKSLAACPVGDPGNSSLRCPSEMKIRYFVADVERRGLFGVAFHGPDANAFFGIGLFESDGTGAVKIAHYTLDGSRGASGVMDASLALARHLRGMGFDWAWGLPTGEFRTRMMAIPGVEERGEQNWLHLGSIA